MADDDRGRSPRDGAEAPAHHSRGFRAVLGRLRRNRATPEDSRGGAEPGPSAEGQVDLVDQAEAFQSLRVADVMTPRADVVAVDVTTPFDELVQRFSEAEHSRMPLYRDTLDDPVGVVHIKDVFKRLAAGGAAEADAGAELPQALRREALYVPASMKASALLLRMQTSRLHLALVIDEFGGTDGLVTLEDLVEAVVGDIDDEHDEAASAAIISRPGGVFEVDARAPVDELEEALGAQLVTEEFEDEEIETVAGLVSALAGRLPQRGEVIAHPAGFDFEVADADPRRVKSVRVRRVERTAAAPGTEAAAPDQRSLSSAAET